MSIIRGYMVPHPPIIVSEVGKGEEIGAAKTIEAYNKVAAEISELKPDTIIITSPHTVMYRDYFHISPGEMAYGDFGQFRAPQVKFKVDYDTELISKISEKADLMGKCVFVASGDLSHCQKEDGPYGYRKEGPEYDERLMKALESEDLSVLKEFPEDLLDKSMECGHRSFCILAGAFYGEKTKIEMLSHEAPFGVGYGVWRVTPEGADEDIVQRDGKIADPYVALAKSTIKNYLESGKEHLTKEELNALPDEMKSLRHGAFVSIHEFGELRGCIGTILPTEENLALEINRNAISASTEDPRFNPVRPEEFPYLEINVDVLSTPEHILSEDELDPKKYGVIVEKGRRRGLLLPDLDGVDTIDQQISIAKQKAGISEDEHVELYRFTVERHK